MRDTQKRYSFRKYRGIGLASVAIATLFFGLAMPTVAANELTSQPARQLAAVGESVPFSEPLASVGENLVEPAVATDSALTASQGNQNQMSAVQPEPVESGETNQARGADGEFLSGAESNQVVTAESVSAEKALGTSPSPEQADAASSEEAEVVAPQGSLELVAVSGTASPSRVGFRSAALPLASETARTGGQDQAGAVGLPLAPPTEVLASTAGTNERLATVVAELRQAWGQGATYERLTDDERARYEAAIYNEYANHLVENTFTNLATVSTYEAVPLRSAEKLSLLTRYITEERRNPIHNGDNQAIVAAARAKVVADYNNTLYEEPTLTGYAQQSPELVKNLIKTVVAGQDLDTIDQNKRSFYGGLYLLHSQYGFENRLPELIVTKSPVIVTNPPALPTNPMATLLDIGGRTMTSQIRTKSELANLLGQNQAVFTRALAPVLGLNSQVELVEKLAGDKGGTPTDYFLKQTEATVQISDQVDKSQLVTWLSRETNLLIPLLAQGQGALVGVTRDSVVVGLNAVYKTAGELPELETAHQRGTAQTNYDTLKTRLNELENFNTFLREASKKGSNTGATAARPLVARDSLVVGGFVNNQDQRVWQTKATNTTIRNLFAPLGDHMSSPTYKPTQNVEGEKQSETHFVAYNTKILGQDKKGLTLYSHEMTHANDERVLFDGAYGGTATNSPAGGNRRQGQGAEVYARSLFEALNNTQTSASSNIRPVFNFNTTVPVTNGRANDQVDQIQPDEPLNTPEKLANYQHKLIKLLMWMEAKEATLALDLSPEDRQLYFNKVEQKNRATGNSTNDQFVATTTPPSSLKDLVDGSYVTAGFTINGTARLGEVKTDGYHFVHLLDSFYGSNYAEPGKNTVGDISFKRNAHEILGWYGFDAMLDYLSGRYDSDQAFLTALQNRQTGKADTISGKVEATPQATKLAQYQALLEMELTNVPEEIKAIYTPETLKKAIDADVAVLRAANGNDQAVYFNMTNVRKLKQKLLTQLIENTEMMTSDPSRQLLDVKGYDVIYVANGATGNGETATTPMSNLKEAIAKVRDGGRIVLVGNVTERTPVTIDKNLTIEGETAEKALLLNQDLTTTKPVTLKGLTLQLNKESQATGLIKAQADLTLDGVSTKISDRQESQRPAIVLEGDQPVNLQILNNRDTKLAAITATTESSLLLDKGVTVVGAVQAQTVEPVTVTSRTNFATEFSGDTLSLTLSENSPAEMTLDGIQSLTLRDGARASLSEDTDSSINDQLTIAAGSILDATINNLSVRTLDGTGTLRFDESAFFEAEHSRAATTIEVTNDTLAYQDEKTYVIIPRRDVEPRVTLTLLDTQLKPNEDGHYIYQAPYQLFHEFEALDSNLTLPASVEELLTAFKDDEELTEAPQKPVNPAKTSIETTEGRWEFKGWVLELDDQAPKIHVYKGRWTYTPKPSTVLLTYTFAFEGKARDQFPENQVTLPAQVTVDKGYAFVQPAAYTQVFESRDGQGEWQFKNWSLPTGTIVQDNQTITGTWTYHAYRTIPITTSYQANDQAEVGTANTIVHAGREGLQSALTNRIVREMQPRVEQVGTKPRVVTNHQDPETLYEADLKLDYGADNVLKQSGQPRLTTTTTTYRLENGRAVANQPVVTVETGQPTIYQVGTKPQVETRQETLPIVYKSDDQLEVGQPNRVEIVGQPRVTTTTTTYRIENGQAVANTPTISRIEGVAQVELVGTKPKVERVETATQILYEADEALEVGSTNVLKHPGRPTVQTLTTTYRLENGRAVANEPVVTVETGQPTIYQVGTKPQVETRQETLPIVYKSDDQLEVGQPNRIETAGQPTVITTTTTYRIENGQAIANTSTVSRTEGLARVELVGTKSNVVETTENLPIIYKSDDTLEVGQPNRIETVGQPVVITTTTTYRIENGQAVANTPTISRIEGVSQVEFVGTKPKVERVETATQILYEADEALEVGSTNVLKQTGRPTVQTLTTTYRLENGRAVANQPVVTVETGQPTIYQVGTKPQVETRQEPLPIVYKSDDTLAVGQPNRIETAGQPTVITTTTTYRIENGQAVANTPTISRIEGVAQVELVGTKPKVERVETAAQILYEADDSLEVGSTNVLKQTGQPGVSIKTTTYRLENGRAVANEPSLVTKSGRPTIYQVGTKPQVETRQETLPIVYKSDDQLEVGQPNRVEIVGQPRVTTTTTTYRIENGQAVANTPTISRIEGVAQVELVGTKPTVERVETAAQILYEADEALEVGSTNVLKQPGQPGVSIKTMTYRLENGRAVANQPVVTVETGRPTIYQVGTKPNVVETTENLPIIYKSDDTLEVGQPNRVEIVGQPRVTTTTTTYRIENGQAVANPSTTDRKPGIARVEVVGTKPTVERVETAAQILYEADEALEVGSTNVLKQTGRPTVQTLTTTYRLENGRAVANQPVVTVETGGPTIYRVGTKPQVETRQETLPIVYKSDDQLEVGQPNRIETADQPTIITTTTTYRIENGQAVANTPTVSRTEGIAQVELVGTKPKVERVETAAQILYEADDSLEVGSTNVLKQTGRPTVQTLTTTYRLENGRAVANEPVVTVETGQPTIYQVGTKPQVETRQETLPIVYKSDDTLEVGQPNRVEIVGQPRVTTTTTTYRIENGQAVANPSTTDRKPGIARVEVVGTKPTVERVETAAQILYEADDSLEVGSTNVLKQPGQPGVSIKTTTYRLENGRAVANEPVVTVETGRPTIYQVGTKPNVVETTENLPIIYKSDDTLEVGQPNRVEIVGQPRVTTTTTTYRIENGQAVANTPTVSRTEGVSQVEFVGTKPTVERVETATQILYEADETLEVGSANVLKQTGQPGVSIKTTTYRLENGRAVANQPVVTVETGQPTIYQVGTKPQVETRQETLPIVYKSDDQLEVGQPNRVEIVGQPRVTTTTTTYRIENGQAIANTSTVSRTEGVSQVEFVGTKPTVERVETAAQILYEADETLEVGSTNVLKQPGQPGVSIKTTTYRLENGRAVANQPVVTVETGQPTIYQVGTKPQVETRQETLPIVYKSDDALEVGQPNRIETVGQSVVITTTTTYRIENGQAVANTPTVSRTEGIAQVELVGTKPTVTIETVALPTIYEDDPTLAAGSDNVVKQIGQPTVRTTTVTYRLENGKAVANAPQVTTILGQPEIQLVGIKQEQNGGSDTTEPLPVFDPSADSDGDGFSNGDELTAGSDPYSADSVPARQNGGSDTTEPLPVFDPSADSDGDGFSDGDELTAGSDPYSADSVPARQNGGSDTTEPLPVFDPFADSDGDGFSNGDELTAGSDPHSVYSIPSQDKDKVASIRLPQGTVVKSLPLAVADRPVPESTKSSATTSSSPRLPETGDSTSLLGLGVLTLLTGLIGFVRRQDDRD